MTATAHKRFVFDFEAYQISNGDFYPKEIAIVNCNDINENYSFMVAYDTVPEEENNTTRFQFHRHGIPWHRGTMTIDEARREVEKIVLPDNIIIETTAVTTTTIYVKGREKANYLRKWLERQERNLKLLKLMNVLIQIKNHIF